MIAFNMDLGVERTAVAVGSCLYLMPLIFALSVFEIGHKKLMQKREAAAVSAVASSGDETVLLDRTN